MHPAVWIPEINENIGGFGQSPRNRGVAFPTVAFARVSAQRKPAFERLPSSHSDQRGIRIPTPKRFEIVQRNGVDLVMQENDSESLMDFAGFLKNRNITHPKVIFMTCVSKVHVENPESPFTTHRGFSRFDLRS
jgi:hypothetical protein